MSNFDEALERFHLVDFEYAGGLANHGPMAAQALVDLGHAALIPAFVDRYVPRMPPAPRGRVLSASEQTGARGDRARVHDWVATFEQRLDARDPFEVVCETVPALIPAAFSAAGHGLLRTVHALRALEAEDSRLRRRELARGLAYWVSTLQSLPAAPSSTGGEEALALAAETEGALARIFDALGAVDAATPSTEPFTAAVRRLDVAGADRTRFLAALAAAPHSSAASVDSLLSALIRVAARLYWSQPEARIAFAHAVTIPAALRFLARRLPPPAAVEAASCAVSVVAAFQGLYGRAGRLGPSCTRPADAEVEQSARSWDEIRYRAACSLEEHAIKLACACLLEARESEHPSLALAAADAALRIEGVRGAC